MALTAGVQYVGDDGPDGSALGRNVSSKIALYGTTPVSQRASSDQATAATVASSASFGSDQAAAVNTLIAFCNEVHATLKNLGAWKGGA